MIQAIEDCTQPRFMPKGAVMEKVSVVQQVAAMVELIAGDCAEGLEFLVLINGKVLEIASNCTTKGQADVLRRALAQVS